MIVLTNCLSQNADEGCLKVAVSLVNALKKQNPQTTVIGYERESECCDVFLPLNKLMLNRKLAGLLRKQKESVLFIPFSAKMRSTALRTFMISLFARKRVILLQSMFSPMGKLAKWLMKLSGAKLVCLSENSFQYYREHLGQQVCYLKAGVDTQRFAPGIQEEKRTLREKYGLPTDKVIVLHVGHLKAGRNIGQFQKLTEEFHGVLVISTHRPDQQDLALGEQLRQKENFTLVDGYQPNIQELYRLSDVYLFPVQHQKSCIDVPLSAMEAAACGIPVVTTAFGELETLLCQEGFYSIESFEPEALNAVLHKAAEEGKSPREAVLAYDWHNAAAQLTEM